VAKPGQDQGFLLKPAHLVGEGVTKNLHGERPL
jgi:hypothetical protein